MARIRSIKPEFWKSEAIAKHTFFTRLVFIGLWTYVDDNGVGLDNPKLIVAELFPLEDDYAKVSRDLRESLASLADAGRIARYTVDGKAYLSITNWAEHQKIDRPAKARYPQRDHPDAETTTFATCGNADSTEILDAPSMHPRETVARVSLDPISRIRDQGTGIRDQGLFAPPPRPTQSTDAPSNAADVVAAYIQGADTAGHDRPAGTLIGRVGRDAKRLITEGHDITKLVAAAEEMGRAGWQDLAVQLQRTSANQKNVTGHKTYAEKRNADGTRDTSKFRKPL
jgi:hypothetical protein